MGCHTGKTRCKKDHSQPRAGFRPAFSSINFLLTVSVIFLLLPRSSGFLHGHRRSPNPHLLPSHPSKTLMHASAGTVSSSSSTTNNNNQQQHSSPPKIPVHLLAGFLGSGKTTTLKHVLENKEDVRVGVIVNDVASVNIDAKLIAQRDDGSKSTDSSSLSSSSSSPPAVLGSNNNDGDIVELQNGCACCSLAGELFDSIDALLVPRTTTAQSTSSSPGDGRPVGKRRRRRRRNRASVASDSASDSATPAARPPYDAIVVELSGVADPLAIRNQWREVLAKNSHPLVTASAELGRIVTLVDATTFGGDYMTYDVLRDREGWLGRGETLATLKDCSGNKQVAYLLAEQVEAADLVVVNKKDLAGDEKVEVARSMAQSLNADAELLVTSHGTISASKLLGLPASTPPPTTTAERDPAPDQDLDRNRLHSHSDSDSHSHSHSHEHAHADSHQDSDSDSHSHSHSHDHVDCDDPDCADPSHSHSHDHDACNDPDCTDPSHSHSHSHDHSACEDPDCTDPSHSHTHSHSHSHSHSHDHDHDHDSCDDPDCTDPSHSHSHSHDHAGDTTLANLGISSFVYKATRPFHARRLAKLIFDWPIPIKDELDVALLRDAAHTGYGIEEGTDYDNDTDNDAERTSPFVGVLRSKGFCWIAPTAWEGLLADPWRHDRSMYWSHAGKHVGIQAAGPFWASLPRGTMEEFFDITQNPKECQRILREDFVTEEFGDRRQELVFIGVDLRQAAIEEALEGCLLTDDEMDEYRQKLESLKQSMKEAAATAAAAAATA